LNNLLPNFFLLPKKSVADATLFKILLSFFSFSFFFIKKNREREKRKKQRKKRKRKKKF